MSDDVASPPTRVLFVCLGNICRSPTAEAVMRGLLAQAELSERIAVESAGTGDWHVGRPPDPRSVAAARSRGVDLDGVARQVAPDDFERFDLLVAMDRSNRDELHRLAPDEGARAKVRMLREFGDGEPLDVPDPYHGGADGFEEVLDIVERSCAALIAQIGGERPT